MPETPEDRLLVALAPSPGNRERAAATIAKLAADLGDVDLLDMIADAAEHPDGVASADVVARSAISYRQLDYWTRRGWLTAYDRTAGSGYVRSYHPREVVKARVMGSLVSLFSMAPGTASEIAEQILATGSAEVEGFKVTRNGIRS
jgi:hypothetical protein